MKATGILEKCKERLESEFSKDHNANRLSDVIQGLEKEFGGDIGGVLTMYAGYIESEYKYYRYIETGNQHCLQHCL